MVGGLRSSPYENSTPGLINRFSLDTKPQQVHTLVGLCGSRKSSTREGSVANC